LSPGDLDRALCGLSLMDDPNLIVGLEKADDAGVYKLSEDLAIIQTIDFFTPVVDDPYVFGQIAVANALSDVYAMGGRPLTAMNVVCFPKKTMDIEILREILAGGLAKMREANVVLVGGHSVVDPELKYGLAVTGVVHPHKVLTNVGAHTGDVLVLTKPLGTGIISTAIKGGMASQESIQIMTEHMVTLNKAASHAIQAVGVSACTDVTGFGFLGHAWEMIQDGESGMIVYATKVPLMKGVDDLARMGMLPGGAHTNREFYGERVIFDPDVPPHLIDILFDPQTSGGLLIAVSREKVNKLLDTMVEQGVENVSIVGEIVSTPKGKIVVKS
jgi:selenide,water dikinase